MSIRIAVIGAGDITIPHLESLKALSANICGIANRSGRYLSELRCKYSIGGTYTDINIMIRETKPDAIYVLVSADNIFGIAKMCLELGIPTFIEKPAGINYEETEILAETAAKKNCLNMVGLNRRFYSSINSSLDYINYECGGLDGILVEDHQPMPQLRAKGKHSRRILDNWLFANSVHCIDLLRHIAGEPQDVSILKLSRIEKNGDCFSMHGFFDGKIVTYTAYWESSLPQRMTMFGKGGAVVLGKNFLQGDFMKNGDPIRKVLLSEEDKNFKPGFFLQNKMFIEKLTENNNGYCDLNDYLKTASLIQTLILKKSN